MAAKFILNASSMAELEARLTPLPHAWLRRKRLQDTDSAHQFSALLESALLQNLSCYPGWDQVHGVATGSWGRGELCPKSDLDMVLLGSEDQVQRLVDRAMMDGLRLRYRMPANDGDWTEGVEPFDILALLAARGLTPYAEKRLHEQQALIRGRRLAPFLLKAMHKERQVRRARYDSIANFLEPNLKYGPGGLRDIEQALMTCDLFASRLGEDKAIVDRLRLLKVFFLNLRQKLHLNSAGDQLVATEQKDLALWLGYKDHLRFMRDVQVSLQAGHFLSDVIAERAGSRLKAKSLPLQSAKHMLQALIKRPSLDVQYQIQQTLPRLRHCSLRGLELEQLFSGSDESLIAAFSSGLMHHVFPHLHRLRGYVQHDQYHRFTADAHLLQALREVKRVKERPARLGKLQKDVRGLKTSDWRILLWTALYHDMAKGLGGDHSLRGKEIASRELLRLGVPVGVVREVKWMVEHHLALSEAAFRQNPASPALWRELYNKGVTDQRLPRLAVFTAIDILATNPEAWNRWKEQLLVSLVRTLESQQTESYFELLKQIHQKKSAISPSFLSGLEPSLVAELPARVLLADYKQLQSTSADLPPLVWRSRQGPTWIRLHSRRDRAGLFADFVQALYDVGASVIGASIQTYPEFGAYDWFHVKTNKSPQLLARMLSQFKPHPASLPIVKFDSVRATSREPGEWVISFRGRDAKGALKAAATALFEAGLTIRWARVHTWGRQIDDVFGVDPLEPKDLDLLLNALQAKLGGA